MAPERGDCHKAVVPGMLLTKACPLRDCLALDVIVFMSCGSDACRPVTVPGGTAAWSNRSSRIRDVLIEWGLCGLGRVCWVDALALHSDATERKGIADQAGVEA